MWLSCLQSAPSQQFRIWFCAWSINELMSVERAMFSCVPTNIISHVSLDCHNTKIILSIHSTLVEGVGRLQHCSGKTCGIGLLFNCVEIVTSSTCAVKLNIILLTKSRISTFLVRGFLLQFLHAARSAEAQKFL